MLKKSLRVEDNALIDNMIKFNLILYILIIVLFSISLFFSNSILKLLSSENAIIISPDEIMSENRDFSYYVKEKGDDKTDSYTVTIHKSDIDKIDEEYISIFTPMIQAEAFEIYLNDRIIAVEGDQIANNSSIWTTCYYYMVPASSFDRAENEFKITQYSRYMTGSLGIDLIIDGYQGSIGIRNIYMIDIHQGIMGVSIGLIFLLILLMVLFRDRKKMYFAMLIPLVLILISYIDYFEINRIGFDYLIFKKIIITSNLYSVIFGTILIRKLFEKNKHSLIFIIVSSMLILIPTIIVKDMISYKKIYFVLSICVMPIFAYWGYLSIKYMKKFKEAKVVLGLTISAITFLIICDILEFISPTVPSSMVVVLPLYSVFILTLIIIDIHTLRINVTISNIEYRKAYRKSIIDGLTELYNATYIQQVVKKLKSPFTMAIFDIDDFKSINDKNGHLAGDKALVSLANVVLLTLREGDNIARYGGDEFILVIKTNIRDIAEKVIERIRLNIEKKVFVYEDKKISMTISIGSYIADSSEDYENILSKADKALYNAKNSGKNKVCFFEDISD